LPYIAVFAYFSIGHDVGKMPYLRARADLAGLVYVAGFVGEVFFFGHWLSLLFLTQIFADPSGADFMDFC
jgi:hypothetical protein